jgi:hypothetical protein
MAIQTAYNETIDAGRAGARVNMEPVDLISRTVEDEAGIGFGKVVQQGAADKGCTATLTGMTAQTYLGVTMRERGVRPETPNAFAQYESALIMRKGVIWVEVAVAVAPSDIVTVTLASGIIGKTAVGAGVVAIPNARWETSTSGAGLAALRLG